MPNLNMRDFMNIPVMIVATLGAIGTLISWSGHDIISRNDIAAVAAARADSVHHQLMKVLAEVQTAQKEDALIREAQIRGECLENSLEFLARQGLLNACQDRNLLIGRTITPSIAAAAVEATPLASPATIRPDSQP